VNCGGNTSSQRNASKNVKNRNAKCENEKAAELKLLNSKFDFGTIEKIEKKIVDFEIENEGNIPLIIYAVDVSCNCLSVDIPRKPIRCGEKAKIRVHINAEKVRGEFNKIVTIKSNAINDSEIIRLKGFIKE